MSRYATQTPTALAAVLAVAALAAAAASVGFPSAASAAPSCAEGPQIEGNVYVGTPCADTIRAPRSVTVVRGEGGDDTLYGQRGNDSLFGGDGHDRLYGGIGDDQLRGGAGDDRLSGGFGADSVLDGEAGNDFVRGDATIDDIQNTGGGIDTLSYATGVTPGFFNRQGPPHFYPDFSLYANFPQTTEGRGAYINLETGKGDNGVAPNGGGVDEQIESASFEVVIGTAFPDFIVGTEQGQTFYGGGGADVILGEGGDDEIFGGDEGDYCDAVAGTERFECEFSGSDREVGPRHEGTVSAGAMAPQSGDAPALYLTGSDDDDLLVAAYSDPPDAPPHVSLMANGTTIDSLDLSEPPDSIILAGLEGEDTLEAAGFPATTSVVLLGGDGGDDLTGGDTEDALVDGPGGDVAGAAGGDDAVPNNEGADDLDAGPGEDLFVSDAICDGDSLDGGADRDNANWANFGLAITIDMRVQKAGLVGPEGQAQCSSPELLTDLVAIEDVEGTSLDDTLVGDTSDNQLLGRPGHDSYFAGPGNDHILANSGDQDLAIDCGADFDTALIDHPAYNDPAPIDCESIEARDPNSFRPPDTPPDPDPEPEGPVDEPGPSSPPPPPSSSPPPPAGLPAPAPELADRTPPHTGILHRPRRRTFTASRFRRVVFAFRSNEAGARFRCKLDRDRFRRCGSRRAYRLRPGRHALRVFAVDRAGNRDRTPTLFKFEVRRVNAHWIRSHRRPGRTR